MCENHRPKPYVCSNMRDHRDGTYTTPGIMHVPEGITKEQLEAFFGRKLYPAGPRLIYQEVFEVKPMEAPSSLIFYMDYQHNKGK